MRGSETYDSDAQLATVTAAEYHRRALQCEGTGFVGRLPSRTPWTTVQVDAPLPRAAE